MKKLILLLVALGLVGSAAGQLMRAKAVARKTAAKAGAAAAARSAEVEVDKDYWVEPMAKVHARFTGDKGTFAHFGDSITVSMAFWASLKWSHKNMDKETQAAFDLVKAYMKDECWQKWKGSKYGNTGRMKMSWCVKNADTWLKDLNPEVVLIMFGTNDLGGVKTEDYEAQTRQAVKKCLDNGSIVILSTIPPRHGADAKVKAYVQATRRVARELKVPLCDFYQACMDRRPEDWSGRHPKFKDVPGGTYEVPTLISRDGVHPSNPKKWRGDYSEEGLKHNGFVLRNYVTLMSYYDVLKKVVKPDVKPKKGK